MSLLLLPADSRYWTVTVSEKVIERLIHQGDEVRIVVEEEALAMAEMWQAYGAHVAPGSVGDADLIERAARGVRSVVLIAPGSDRFAPILAAIVEGLSGPSTSGTERPRLIVCLRSSLNDVLIMAATSGFDHIVLTAGHKGGAIMSRLTWGIAPERIAEAIDAADDLAGHPQLVLDLNDDEAWHALRLAPPG